MLRSISDANEFMVQEVEKITGEKVDMAEQAILEDILDERFFEKIGDAIDENEVQKMKLEKPEEIEGYLFHKIPNYLTILEETTTEVLSDYLSE